MGDIFLCVHCSNAFLAPFFSLRGDESNINARLVIPFCHPLFFFICVSSSSLGKFQVNGAENWTVASREFRAKKGAKLTGRAVAQRHICISPVAALCLLVNHVYSFKVWLSTWLSSLFYMIHFTLLNHDIHFPSFMRNLPCSLFFKCPQVLRSILLLTFLSNFHILVASQ